MKVKIRYIFLGLFLLLIAIMSLNYSGMCVSRLSWLSEEERLKKTFEFIFNRNKFYISSEKRYVEHAGSTDSELLLKESPDCCWAGRASVNSYNPFFIDRVFGINNGFFTNMNYSINYINLQGRKALEPRKNSQFFQTNCGKILID